MVLSPVENRQNVHATVFVIDNEVHDGPVFRDPSQIAHHRGPQRSLMRRTTESVDGVLDGIDPGRCAAESAVGIFAETYVSRDEMVDDAFKVEPTGDGSPDLIDHGRRVWRRS